MPLGSDDAVQVHVGPVRRSDPVRTPDAISALMRQDFIQAIHINSRAGPAIPRATFERVRTESTRIWQEPNAELNLRPNDLEADDDNNDQSASAAPAAMGNARRRCRVKEAVVAPTRPAEYSAQLLRQRRLSSSSPPTTNSKSHRLYTCSSHLHPPPICHPRRNDRPLLLLRRRASPSGCTQRRIGTYEADVAELRSHHGMDLDDDERRERGRVERERERETQVGSKQQAQAATCQLLLLAYPRSAGAVQDTRVTPTSTTSSGPGLGRHSLSHSHNLTRRNAVRAIRRGPEAKAPCITVFCPAKPALNLLVAFLLTRTAGGINGPAGRWDFTPGPTRMQLNITTLLAFVFAVFTAAAPAPVPKRGVISPPKCLECVIIDEAATVPN
ncbi:hypothetical protein C8F01DRAFT_1081383 [Mycena amicta]|nr:hypothetical protein C8F01DRAFT_1081383 [Mycena amicta]